VTTQNTHAQHLLTILSSASAPLPLATLLPGLQAALSAHEHHAEAVFETLRYLLLDGLGLPASVLHDAGTAALSSRQCLTLHGWLSSLLTSSTPVQYLVGQVWFDGHPFGVSPAVLIPRPETEGVVEQAWQHLVQWVPIVQLRQSNSNQTDRSAEPLVVDFCTGSGCIAIALAKRWQAWCNANPQSPLPAKFVGVDACPEALVIARSNANVLAVEALTSWACADVLQSASLNALKMTLGGQLAAIITMNPPYIPHASWQKLAANVRDHEPQAALVADEVGLQFYRVWAEHAHHWLAPGGAMVMELGVWDEAHTQQQGLFHEQVMALWAQAGFSVRCHNDLAGLPRVVVAHL